MSPVTTLRRIAALCALVAAAAASPGVAADIPDLAANPQVAIEEVDAAITAVEARDNLDEETRGEVLEQLRDARARLQSRDVARQAAATFAAAIDEAPAETADLRAALEAPPPEPPTASTLGVDDDTPLRDLEQRLVRESALLDSIDAEVLQLEAAIAALEQFPSEARTSMATLRDEIAQSDASLAAEPPPDEPVTLTQARQLATGLRQGDGLVGRRFRRQ